jgi:hypothetical protein
MVSFPPLGTSDVHGERLDLRLPPLSAPFRFAVATFEGYARLIGSAGQT